MASVFSRHVITICKTFRETKIIVSVPIPRKETSSAEDDCLKFYESMRLAFSNCLKANLVDMENAIICCNDNLVSEDNYSDCVNLNNNGMKKLTKNWEAIIHRMERISENLVYYRRSSESSSFSSSSGGSAGSTSNSESSSSIHRKPWKPY